MKIRILESISIDGEIQEIGASIEVSNSLAKELVWRKAATVVRARPSEKLAQEIKDQPVKSK